MGRPDADSTVAAARRLGIALDAFSQVDREWEEVPIVGDVAIGEPLAGFVVYVHILESIDNNDLRLQIFETLTDLGADVGGFDRLVDVFGSGIDYSLGDDAAELAAMALSSRLNQVINMDLPPRPQSSISSRTTMGLWLSEG